MHADPATQQLRDMIEDAMELGLSDRAANEMHNALSNLEVSLALPLTHATKADPRMVRILHAYRQGAPAGPIEVAACGHVRGTDITCGFGDNDADFQDAACADCFTILMDQDQAQCA